MPRRPGGVVLIAVLAWIGSALQIVSGALVLSGAVRAEGIGTESAWVGIASGVIAFVVAFFLFTGSRVARALVTISFALSLVTAVVAVVVNPANLAAPIISALIAIIGLALLYTARANDYFRR